MRNWDEAEKSNNTALSYASDDQSRLWVEKNAAAIAAGRGRYQEACNLYLKTIQDARNTPIVLWESYAALAMLHTATKDYAKANVEFEKAIEVIDNNSDKISIPDYRLTFFSRVIEFYQHYVQSLMAQRDYQRALEVADSSRARILLERLSSHRTLRRSSASDYLKIARASHSVLLFYWIAPEQSYLWVVTPARIYPPFQLPPAAQIRGWVDRYRAFVEQRIGDPMASENEAGRRLYESLIAPAAELIPPGSRVILFPDDALNWLSFETLPVYGKTPKQKPHYWIEDVRPVLGPSLAVLNTEEEKMRRAPDSMLIIGDPVSADPEFPKLEFASKEIQTIEAQLPSARKKVFTGSAARPDAYRESRPRRLFAAAFQRPCRREPGEPAQFRDHPVGQPRQLQTLRAEYYRHSFAGGPGHDLGVPGRGRPILFRRGAGRLHLGISAGGRAQRDRGPVGRHRQLYSGDHERALLQDCVRGESGRCLTRREAEHHPFGAGLSPAVLLGSFRNLYPRRTAIRFECTLARRHTVTTGCSWPDTPNNRTAVCRCCRVEATTFPCTLRIAG